MTDAVAEIEKAVVKFKGSIRYGYGNHYGQAYGVSTTEMEPSTETTIGEFVSVPTGTVEFEGNAPTTETTRFVTVQPDPAQLSFAGVDPAVTVGESVHVQLQPASLDFGGLDPTTATETFVTVQPDPAEVSFSGLEPQSQATKTVTITPEPGTIEFEGNAPADVISQIHVTVQPDIATIRFEGNEPPGLGPPPVIAHEAILLGTWSIEQTFETTYPLDSENVSADWSIEAHVEATAPWHTDGLLTGAVSRPLYHPTVIESFAHGNLDDYAGALADFDVIEQDYDAEPEPRAGQHVLRQTEANESLIYSHEGLIEYPEYGDAFQVSLYADAGGGPGFVFGYRFNEGHLVRLQPEQDRVLLYWLVDDEIDHLENFDEVESGLEMNHWYTLHVQWGVDSLDPEVDSDVIRVDIYDDEEGIRVGRFEAETAEREQQSERYYVGWHGGENAPNYYDDLRFVRE